VGFLVQPTPHQVRTSAQIDNAPREAFIHRHIRFSGKRIARVESGSVSADAFFVAERLPKSRSQDQPAIFDGVMRIDFQVALATQPQVHDRMFGEEHQHVVQERNARFHGCLSDAIQIERQRNPRLTRRASKGRLTIVHSTIKGGIGSKTKRKFRMRNLFPDPDSLEAV
jgi:hypothetical protein